MMRLKAISSVLGRHALVAGQVRDALTGGAPVRTPTLTLTCRLPGAAEFVTFPAPVRLLDGSSYVCNGEPAQAFAALSGTDVLECRLRVAAPRYAPAQHDFAITAADRERLDLPVIVHGLPVTMGSWPRLPVTVDVALQPLPVALSGFLIEDSDPDSPVAGARVRITAPEARGPVTTDARGHFRIDELPVATTVTVSIELDARSLVRDVVVHPTEPINRRTFSLPA
jgi:hypothetical protein